MAVDEPGDQDLLGPQVGEHLRADAEAARHHGRGVLGLAVGAQHLRLAGDAQHVLLRRAVDAVVQVGQAARQRLGPQRVPAQVGDALGDPFKVVGRRRIRHLERIHAAYDTPSPPAHSHRAQATAGWWSPRRPAIRSSGSSASWPATGSAAPTRRRGWWPTSTSATGWPPASPACTSASRPSRARCRSRPAACARPTSPRRRPGTFAGRSLRAHLERGRARGRGRAGARRDRPRRRLPGEPRAAPAGAVHGVAARARGGARAARSRVGARPARRRLVDRLGHAGALPADPRRPRPHDADQGHPPGRPGRADRRRAPRTGPST